MHVFTIPVFFWRLLLPIHYSIGFLLTYIYQTVRPFASLTCSHMPMVFQRSCCTENDNLCVRLNIKIYFASIYLVKILCNIHERARTHTHGISANTQGVLNGVQVYAEKELSIRCQRNTCCFFLIKKDNTNRMHEHEGGKFQGPAK